MKTRLIKLITKRTKPARDFSINSIGIRLNSDILSSAKAPAEIAHRIKQIVSATLIIYCLYISYCALNSVFALHLKISIDAHNVAPHTTTKKIRLDLA